MKTLKFLIPLLVLAGAALAQAQEGARLFYKLDFVVKEVEGGKTVNSRTFSTMLAATQGQNAQQATIRAGGRVAVPTGATSFNNYDLGVNIDARDLRESQSDVSLGLTVDITTIAQEKPEVQPVLRQNRWAGTVLVPVKKSTVVFASDDITSKRQLQLEMIATPVK
jgi:hypothetical protein